MRRRVLCSNQIEGKPIIEANYADICYYNSDTEQFVIVDAAEIDNYTDAIYTPIGIVAVPSSHTDEGRPRIMSLVHMNCDTPTTGSTSIQDMFWGVYGTVVSELAQKQGYPYMGTSNTTVTTTSTVRYKDDDIYLPSDANGQNGLNNFTYANPSNSNEHFYDNGNSSYGFMCSPYKQDGSKDTRYFDTSNTGNVLADFDGRSNTDKILAQRGSKDYTTWKPNDRTEEDYPAASCCGMFSTVGTNQGDWYLPSAGELGYAIARMQAIQNSMQALVTKGYTASLLSPANWYWSSTQYSDNHAGYVAFRHGFVSCSGKDNSYYVRSFLAL